MYFIGRLFTIQKADAAQVDGDDQLKIEIAKAREEIQKLKNQINAIKNGGTLNEAELKEAKAQLRTVIDQIKVAAMDAKTNQKTSGDDLEISADKIEKAADVEAEISIQKGAWVGTDETLVTVIYGPDGNEITLSYVHEKLRDGKFSIKVEFNENAKPGLYKVITTLTKDGKTYVTESEFAWGLVSLNTVKSIYKPGETAEFIIVVLDNEGHPVSNANLVMSITAPNSEITNLSSGNGITENAESGLYDAEYITTIEGTYNVDITAQTEGINTDFSTTFDVSEYFEFDIIRTAQSKVDPINNPNSFDVKVNIESFVGGNTITVTETVPSVFGVVTDGNVETVGDNKIITWNKSLIDGKTSVEYSYSIPLVFPELYALGPIEINYGQSQTFTESRPWFVAADPVTVAVN